MAKPLRNLSEKDEATAMKYVDGYRVGIDITARNVQDEAKKQGLPWTLAKGFDTFLPLRYIHLLSLEIRCPGFLRLLGT